MSGSDRLATRDRESVHGPTTSIGSIDDPAVTRPDRALAPATPPAGGPGPAPGEPPWWRWAAWALAAAVVVPIVVAGAAATSRAWFPAGDWAMTELRVLDVGTRHTPLVGPYSRYHWNHPGPLLFWLLAVPYRLAGTAPGALLVGAALINATSVGGILALAWRRGRLALVAAVALPLALCVHALGATTLRDPWNAWIAVLAFGLAVTATWSAVDGDRAGLVTLAPVLSFLVQSHVGYAPFALVLGAAAVAGYRRRVPRRRDLLLAGAVALACWVPVLADLAAGGDNLGLIIGYFAGGGGDTAGLGTALGVVAHELGGTTWLYGIEEANPVGGGVVTAPVSALVLPVAAGLAAAALAWWRRDHPPLRLLAVVAAAAVAGLVAVSRISGGVFDYLVRWWWPLTALWWAAVGWSLVRAVAAWRPSWSAGRAGRAVAAAAAPVALAAVGIAVALLAVGVIRHAGGDPLPVDDWGPSMAAMEHALPRVPHGPPVLVRNVGPLSGWASDAVSALLARDGVDVRVDDTGINRYKFGAHRLRPAQGDQPLLWVVTGSWIGDFERQGEGRLLASYDPLSPEDRAEVTEAEGRLGDALRAAGRDQLVSDLDEGTSLWGAGDVAGVDPDDLDRVEAARARGVPVALYAFADASGSLPEHVLATAS